MKTVDEWLAEYLNDRPDDFAPGEVEQAKAFVRNAQADALEAAAVDCELMAVIATTVAAARGPIGAEVADVARRIALAIAERIRTRARLAGGGA